MGRRAAEPEAGGGLAHDTPRHPWTPVEVVEPVQPERRRSALGRIGENIGTSTSSARLASAIQAADIDRGSARIEAGVDVTNGGEKS